MIFYIDEVFYQDRSVFLSGNRGVDRAYVLCALENRIWKRRSIYRKEEEEEKNKQNLEKKKV